MPATRLRRLLYWGETVVGLAAGVASAIHGMAYLPPLAPGEVPPTLSAIGGDVPLTVYAALWVAVLPTSVAAIWYRKLWVPTVAAVAGLCALTGVVSVLSWAVNGAAGGWSVAASYGLMAVLIGGAVLFASIAERQQVLIEVNPRGRT